MEKDKLKKAELYAINYLSYRSRTEKEVYEKLRLSGRFDDETVGQTVSLLKKQGYVDDAKYAEAFASSKSRNKLDGKRKIRQMLLQKGISSEAANAALASLEADGELDERAAALKLIDKKAKGKLDTDQKNKLFAYLTRKGYSISSIKEAFADYDGQEFHVEYEPDTELWD